MSESQGLPRKLTAVATIGKANQLFTVFESNWNCNSCNQENYAARPRCSRCKKQKPQGLNNYVMDPALSALQSGVEICWQEVLDPASKQLYYYNSQTGVTQWERPAEMGPTPLASGWFGRGKAGSTAAQLYHEMNRKYLQRPARKQKEFVDPKKYHLEGANEFNIWYGRFLGESQDNKADKEPASDRCVLETDAGYTKADTANPDKKHRKYFCLYFAHGICAKGADCIFYHRIPLPEDDAHCDELFDCFGRQRHNKHRDDMNGVGTFMKPCRTLFVGNLLKTKYNSPKSLEDALWRHFGEWGEVESINVIHRISIAFPRYRLRTSAEFAKEAMTCQTLDKGEILSIRWAHDDPNPVAQDSIERADKDAIIGLLQSKGISLKPAEFEYPIGYQLPDAKRTKLDESGVDDMINQLYPQLAYPDTDGQYGTNEGVWTTSVDNAHSNNNNTDTVTAAVHQDDSNPIDNNNNNVINTQSENKGDDNDWEKHVDESSGAHYYFNVTTGESSWVDPNERND
eukprot:gene7445-10146_t